MKKLIIGSTLAGIAIAIGGTAYLRTEKAWLFPIGLLIVCLYNLPLFTGRVCYYNGKDIQNFLLIYVFNTISAYLCGMAIGWAQPILYDKTFSMVQAKLSEGWKLIPLAILCNVLIFVAVDSFKKGQNFWGEAQNFTRLSQNFSASLQNFSGKVQNFSADRQNFLRGECQNFFGKRQNFLGLIFATTVFVACGFEHCIANAFYFGLIKELSAKSVLYLLSNAGWNACGGILAYRLARITKGID